MSKRKLWKTRANRTPLRERHHESQAAAYWYVNSQRGDYAAGGSVHSVSVWVDERDGRGWQRYEVVDFAAEQRGES